MSALWDDWLTPGGTLLVLAPHPDDDVLGCARLMQQAEAAGCDVVIIWLTDGGASHGALSPSERADLIARRRAEALAGVNALGLARVATCFLDHPDGRLAEFADEAGRNIDAIRCRHGATTVAVTDKDDGHPDHRAAYAIATALPGADILSYPVSTRFDGNAYAPPPGALLLPAMPGDGKRAALLEHRSQREAAAIVPMTLATIDRFCAEPEIFIPVRKGTHAG